MWDHRKRAAAERFAERRDREDNAPRLATLVPDLETLKLAIEERSSWPGANPEGSHVRHVMVPTAPALFLITCHDPQCREGGHDLTTLVMRALRAREMRFEAKDQCYGTVGTSNCQRIISLIGTATYSQEKTA